MLARIPRDPGGFGSAANEVRLCLGCCTSSGRQKLVRMRKLRRDDVVCWETMHAAASVDQSDQIRRPDRSELARLVIVGQRHVRSEDGIRSSSTVAQSQRLLRTKSKPKKMSE